MPNLSLSLSLNIDGKCDSSFMEIRLVGDGGISVDMHASMWLKGWISWFGHSEGWTCYKVSMKNPTIHPFRLMNVILILSFFVNLL